MASKYERMGVFVSDVGRSAIGLSLKEGVLNLEELQKEVCTRLDAIGEELSPEKIKRHLKVLEERGILERDPENRYRLTENGRQALEELTRR